MSATPRLDAVIATERTIAFRAAYVDVTGDVASALMLAQVIYWTPRTTIVRDGRSWIAKADASWYDEIRLSPDQARRARRVLQDARLIEVRTFKFNGTPMTHIALNSEAMETALATLSDGPPSDVPPFPEDPGEPKSTRSEPQVPDLGRIPSRPGQDPKSYTERTFRDDSRDVTRKTAPTAPEPLPLFPDTRPPPTGKAATPAQVAKLLTDGWYQSHDRPQQRYVAVLKIVTKALKDGWDERDLAQALDEMPTVSGASLDYWRNRRTRPNGAHRPGWVSEKTGQQLQSEAIDRINQLMGTA